MGLSLDFTDVAGGVQGRGRRLAGWSSEGRLGGEIWPLACLTGRSEVKGMYV